MGLLLLTVPTNVRFVWQDVTAAAAEVTAETTDLNALPAFWPRADLEAMEWARTHLPKDGPIFCCRVSGSFFAALAGRPVYLGHFSETPNQAARCQETADFYSDAHPTPAKRRAFLEARGIRYVYQGTTERYISATDLARDPLFRCVYANRGAAIYELLPAGQEPPHEVAHAAASPYR